MASSTLPSLSLLAKGIGQTVSNGHEKLEVYLEPKDYYNLKSRSFAQLASLQHKNGHHLDVREEEHRPANIHKTFVTRKGALLIFSEELANKALKDTKELYARHPTRIQEKNDLKIEGTKFHEESKEEDSLRTVHDLRVAILMYGNQPDYRKKGNDLYLRFVHNARAPNDERYIRPGFSPNRYMSAWSKLWHQEMLKKLQQSGLVQSTSLYRKDPLLPQFYQHEWYNLSTIPPPYRVTRNMLHAWDGSNYDYQRMRRAKAISEITFGDEKLPSRTQLPNERAPLAEDQQLDEEQEHAIPVGSIQAVRFLESGEVEEVKYSELKQHEKQEILAELLATAWEHGKHIEQMLDLVLSSSKPRTSSAASSSAASELMMDMHKAILSLAESPVRRQIREKQMQLNKEKQTNMKGKEDITKKDRKHRKHDRDLERQERRQKRERKKEVDNQVQHAFNDEKKHEPAENQAEKDMVNEKELRRAARHKARKERELEKAKQKEREIQKEKEREQRRGERENIANEKRTIQKEMQSHETIQIGTDEKTERRTRKEHTAERKEEPATVLPSEEEQLIIEKRRREERREERRRRRKEQEEQKAKEATEKEQSPKEAVPSHQKMPSHQTAPSYEKKRIVKVSERKDSSSLQPVSSRLAQTQNVENVEMVYAEPGVEYIGQQSGKRPSVTFSDKEPVLIIPSSQDSAPQSRPMPFVPHNTPATQQRPAHIQRQLPLENVIYEAKSKRSYASSSTSSRKSSQKMMSVYRTPTIVSSGDGQFATYIEPKKATSKPSQVKTAKKEKAANFIPEPVTVDTMPQASSKKSSLAFSVSLPEQSQPSLGKSSFYGGAMPISSNIASQDHAAPSESLYELSASGKSVHIAPATDHLSVPAVGDDGSSTGQQSYTTTKKSSRTFTMPSHASTESKRQANPPEYSESDDEPADSSSQLTYQILKGLKGPGSQSSAAFSRKSESKKSSVARGNIPHALLDQKHAAIYMPDKEIVDVRALPPQQSYDSSSSTTYKNEKSSSVTETEQQRSTKSSNAISSVSERKQEPKVTFDEALKEESEENEESELEETESETSEKSEAGWPPAEEKLRPMSSRSAKLTDHAQKVAEIVVMTQRPDSKLEEDASRAAKLWNKIAKSEAESSTGTESYETATEDDADSSQWNAAGIEEKVEKESVKSSIKKAETASKASSQKSATTSVKSSKTATSQRTSVSSVQEAFIKEVKRKASELGIDEKELQFEPELVEKVFKSTVDPNEVEVFHDHQEGKHVVRSRHSSFTAKSQRTDASSPSESKQKQKFVVAVPREEETSTQRPATASTDSSTVSPSSSRLRKLSQSSSTHSKLTKSSIPACNEDVALKYDVTSYERKPQPDGKHEAPLIVSKDKKIEPEKLDHLKTEKPKVQEKKKSTKTKKDEESKKTEKKVQPPSQPSSEKGKATHEKVKDSDATIPTDAKVESTKSEEEKSLDSKSMKKMRIKKGKEKQKSETTKPVEQQVTVPTGSPVKPKTKSPEVPFVAGRAKDDKAPKGLEPKQEPATTTKQKKSKSPKAKKTAEKKTEEPERVTSPAKEVEKQIEEEKKPKTPVPAKSPAPTKSETPAQESDLGEPGHLSSIPSVSPEDDYAFVRVEESPVPSEPEPEVPEPLVEPPADDQKSLTSDKTGPTEATADTDNSEELLRAAEEEEARQAKKKEKDEKRLAAAEKRRLEVERKRKEKEEQMKKEKEELERQEAMREELEKEQRKRTEEMQRRRQEAEQARLREQQEEELRRKREQQQLERERRMQEEHKKKLEELQRRKREEELRKAEEARIKAEEERIAREQEQEMLAQMAEEEVLEYQRRKKEEMEEKKRLEEERRRVEEEQARIAFEQARLQAIIKAKQQAAFEEKRKFARGFLIEANGMEQTQNVHRAFTFSYFEILKLLGLDITDIDLD